jgi:hypothetical protein
MLQKKKETLVSKPEIEHHILTGFCSNFGFFSPFKIRASSNCVLFHLVKCGPTLQLLTCPEVTEKQMNKQNLYIFSTRTFMCLFKALRKSTKLYVVAYFSAVVKFGRRRMWPLIVVDRICDFQNIGFNSLENYSICDRNLLHIYVRILVHWYVEQPV